MMPGGMGINAKQLSAAEERMKVQCFAPSVTPVSRIRDVRQCAGTLSWMCHTFGFRIRDLSLLWALLLPVPEYARIPLSLNGFVF